jgi:phosphoenolpyruvate carboxykinase (ATP)
MNPVYRNLSKPELIEHAIRNQEGVFNNTGALITNTQKFTGRSPNDKFTVEDDLTKNQVWYHDGNKRMSPEDALSLFQKVEKHLASRPQYVVDCQAGASLGHALRIRVHTENAWHALFCNNMFIENDPSEASVTPEFSIYHAPSFLADKTRDKTNSEAAIVIDFSRHRVIICGTQYAGEIKKSVFTVLNFLLPNKGVLGMHCSANKSASGETALFFGLSGTGKTTLSADVSRSLIGDDEHGWDDAGIFNFEGGCYAKVIKLSKVDEPQIYSAIHQFTSILENVVYDEKTRELDLNDDRYTENTRSSYDISFISNADLSRVGAHPRHVIMLTCDAFGVLPPVAKLSADAAMYHFLSGYTARVAGTERGVKEPKAVFSPCFGGPFMAHFPTVYAKILKEKIATHGSTCWLVNTGWIGGAYGVGNRIKISWTRAMLHAILEGKLLGQSFKKDKYFNLDLPEAVPEVPKEILNPINSWKNPQEYDEQAKKLVRLFGENFKPYRALVSPEIELAGPTSQS